MRKFIRVPVLATGAVAAAMLAGCASDPLMSSYPAHRTVVPVASAPVYHGTAPVAVQPVAGVEYGRILNIEYMPAGSRVSSGPNILGALVGGLAGAAVGNQIGGGSGRTAATVLGGAAGAVVGNQIARNAQGVTTAPGYRITMQTDHGVIRTYEVPSTGNLRVGDRVRVDNGVIYMA